MGDNCGAFQSEYTRNGIDLQKMHLSKSAPAVLLVLSELYFVAIKNKTRKNTKCSSMFDKLMKQMAETEGITEEFKATGQMAWVCKMENIHSRAMEIVNKELIFV